MTQSDIDQLLKTLEYYGWEENAKRKSLNLIQHWETTPEKQREKEIRRIQGKMSEVNKIKRKIDRISERLYGCAWRVADSSYKEEVAARRELEAARKEKKSKCFNPPQL